MVVIRGRLEPEVGSVVMQALTAARTRCIGVDGSGAPQTAARAFPRERRNVWRATPAVSALPCRQSLPIPRACFESDMTICISTKPRAFTPSDPAASWSQLT